MVFVLGVVVGDGIDQVIEKEVVEMRFDRSGVPVVADGDFFQGLVRLVVWVIAGQMDQDEHEPTTQRLAG